jgi:prepilin-type N-terminal cleavage/methylation domain-containing protein
MIRTQQKGFTLVEIMIVVLIIGILLAIAVPNFINSRSRSRLQAVQNNLQEINSAKTQFAIELGLSANSSVNDAADLCPGFLKAWPVGPVQGTYTANPVGADPTFNGQTSSWYAMHCSGPTADSACTL